MLSSLFKILIASIIVALIGIGGLLASPNKNTVDKTNLDNIPQAEDLKKTTRTYILLGDTGTGGIMQYDVSEAILNYCLTKFCQAAFIAGDVIYNAGAASVEDQQFATKFEKPYANINFPIYIAYGNHDYLGCVDCYIEYSSKSSKWQMPAKYYSQKFDSIEFFIINTEDFNIAQRAWLKQQFSNSPARWKVVVGHRPIITYEQVHAGENWRGKDELKTIACDTADLYISGHSHLLEDVGPINNCQVYQIISGGGGAYTRKILSNNQDNFYFEGNGFVALSVLEDKLLLEFINSVGKIVHTNKIRR